MISVEKTVDAAVKNLDAVTEFVNDQLEAVGCPLKLQMQIDVVIDELFSNIAYYAYAPEHGTVTVGVRIDESAISLRFTDAGRPFDPLAKEDPDVTLRAQDRVIGGLGIFMVKKMATDVRYEYSQGHNILTVVFAR